MVTAKARERPDQTASAVGLEFDWERIDREPVLFTECPLDIPPHLSSPEYLEDLIASILKTHSGRFSRTFLAGRCSATAPEQVETLAVDDLDFSGCLEERLTNENLHVTIRFLEQFDTAVRQLVDDCTEALCSAAGASHEDVLEPTAGLFLSSPNSIARLHTDSGHGLLCHLRGTKTLHVYPDSPEKLKAHSKSRDQGVFQSREATRSYMDDCQDEAWSFDLIPGQATLIPSAFPHWVQNGNNLNMSFSFYFYTRRGLQRQKVIRLNQLVKRHTGIDFAPFAGGVLGDRIKSA